MFNSSEINETKLAFRTIIVSSYRLVAEQDVHVWHDLHQGLLEELADEGRREVHAEDLVILRGVLGHLQD